MRLKEQRLSRPTLSVSELDSGLYVLILRILFPLNLKVGALGEIDFPPGYYAYCGSARKCLSDRLSRHMRQIKKLRWHVDYLTSRKDICVESARIFALDKLSECVLNGRIQSLSGAGPVRGFGCSDCSCISHLTFFGAKSPCMRFIKNRSHD